MLSFLHACLAFVRAFRVPTWASFAFHAGICKSTTASIGRLSHSRLSNFERQCIY